MSSKPTANGMQSARFWFGKIVLTMAVLGCGHDARLEPVRHESAAFLVESKRGTEAVCHIPGSVFLMGTDTGEEDERPERRVHISGFFLHASEVTVDGYAECVDSGTCQEPAIGGECNWRVAGREDHPVNCVSWYDAVTYCEWVGGRLPTEAEWEKAGRGEIGRYYPWGDETPDCDRAAIGISLGCGELSTWPVGSFPAGRSVYGVSDLVGNVYEWTLDSYDSQSYRYAGDVDPVNLQDSNSKVLRGNSWYYSDPALDSRLPNRYPFPPLRFYPYIGFRCAFPGDEDPVAFSTADVLAENPTLGIRSGNWMDRNLQARMKDGEALPDDRSLRQGKVKIPAGKFVMGSEEGEYHERPVREVHLKAYEIDRYEVSVAEYAECVEAGVCVEPYAGGPVFPKEWEWENCNWGVAGRAYHPINCVNWNEANTFCRWAEKRLPTEAEWEKAARGVDGRRYPWGSEQPDCDRAVIDAGGDGCGRETTWQIGSKPLGESPYGVSDMSGNVWEWVDDWYAYDYYTRAPDKNPRNTDELPATLQAGWVTGKVLRGGSWADQATSIHSASHRLGYPQNVAPDYTVGFRCARDVTP